MATASTNVSTTATAAQASLQAKRARRCFTAQDDLCLLREVAATKPFGDDIKWIAVIENVKRAVGRVLTLRGAKDRVDILIGYWRQQDAKNLKKSGTEEQYAEKEQILQDLSDYARAINYEPRIMPRSAGTVMSRKRRATSADCPSSVATTVRGERAGSTDFMLEATGSSSNPATVASSSCVTGAMHESPAAHLLMNIYDSDSAMTPPTADPVVEAAAADEQPTERLEQRPPSPNDIRQQQHVPAGQSAHQPATGADQGQLQPATRRLVLPVTTRGTRGLQSMGLQLLTMRENHEYELREKEIENERKKIDNEARRLALEERKLDLEERKLQLEISRRDKDNEKLLESLQKMINEQTQAIINLFNGSQTRDK